MLEKLKECMKMNVALMQFDPADELRSVEAMKVNENKSNQINNKSTKIILGAVAFFS